MHPDLERLIRLQHTESQLHQVEAALAEVPRERADLEGRLAEEKGRLEAAREALSRCQKSRREHEGALQELETKRSKYKGQLMEVKTNREYTAMLHEIEAVEREIRSREDLILGEMERAEGLAADVKREDGSFQEAEARHRQDARALDERAKTLDSQRAQLASERDAVAATIPEDLLALFQRVARLRGSAVGEARDGMCLVCHVKLRLQMFVDLKRNDSITQCASCSRILYYEPQVPVVAPEP